MEWRGITVIVIILQAILVESKFKYKINYKYDYEVETRVHPWSEGADTSKEIIINYRLSIIFNNEQQCTLNITHSEVNEGYSGLYLNHLSHYPVRFVFNDGKIGRIWFSPDEPEWVRNIKKGLISIFQNSMSRFDVDQAVNERDIHGDCFTKYKFKELNASSIIIQKDKKMMFCKNRHSILSTNVIAGYLIRKAIGKVVPVRSTVMCTQQIDHNVISAINCREDYAFVPVPKAKAFLSYSVITVTLLDEDRLANFEIRQVANSLENIVNGDLIYFHHHYESPSYNSNDTKVDVIKLICSRNSEFHHFLLNNYRTFVYDLRKLHEDTLYSMYHKFSEACPDADHFFLETLPVINSNSAMNLMFKLIYENKINLSLAESWIRNCAFYASPEKQLIESGVKLLNTSLNDEPLYLSLSSMINLYCNQHSKCDQLPSVQRFLSIIHDNLNHLRNGTNSKALLSLKALGNMGVWTDDTDGLLRNIIYDDSVDIALRSAAIEAYRNIPCGADRTFLMNLYKDWTMDQLLRISAYLQVMKCPTYTILKDIQRQLEEEKFNQVGSFVWSHLSEIMKSSIPNHVGVQSALYNEQFNEKFNQDFRKYSKYRQRSFYINKHDIGLFVSNAVIFSEKSFIPKILTFSVGASIENRLSNLLEVTIHLGECEDVYYKYIKQKSILLSDILYSILEGIWNGNAIKNRNAYLDQILNLYSDLDYQEKLQISVSVKHIDLEYRQVELHTVGQLIEFVESLNPIEPLVNFLQGKEINIDESHLLLDIVYTIPTTTGLPMKITTNAITLVRVLANSEALQPRVGINVETGIVNDLYFSEYGIVFNASLYTLTDIECLKDLTDTSAIFRINIPMDESYLLHFETKLVIKGPEGESVVERNPEAMVTNQVCTWPAIEDALGLKLCLFYHLPNYSDIKYIINIFDFGSMKFVVSLEKTDLSIKQYLVKHIMDREDGKTTALFSLETPNAKTNKTIVFQIDFNNSTKAINMNYKSAKNELSADGWFSNTEGFKKLNFTLYIKSNKTQKMDISMEYATTEGKYGISINPKLKISNNNRSICSLEGSYRWTKKFEVSQYDVILDLESPIANTTVTGYLRTNDNSIALNVKLDYQLWSTNNETFRIEVKLGSRPTVLITKIYGSLHLESSVHPNLNLITTYKYQKTDNHNDWSVDALFNPYEEDKNQRLYLQWVFQYYKTYIGRKIETIAKINKPSRGINIALEFRQVHTFNVQTNVFVISYGEGKSVVTNLDITFPRGNIFFTDCKYTTVLNPSKDKIEIIMKINELAPGEYDVDIVCDWFSGRNTTLKGMYLDKSNRFIQSHSVKLICRRPDQQDVLLNARFICSETDIKSDFLVLQGSAAYGVSFEHRVSNSEVYYTFGEIVYNPHVYSVMVTIDYKDKIAKCELHFDKFRDVRAIVKFAREPVTDLGIDIKWNANRDPTQKLILHYHVSKKDVTKTYKVTVEIPKHRSSLAVDIAKDGIRRVVDALFDLDGTHYSLYVNGTIDLEKSGIIQLDGLISTPIQNWTSTAIDFRLVIQPMSTHTHLNLHWVNAGSLGFEASYNLIFLENFVRLSAAALMNSRLSSIKSRHLLFDFQLEDWNYKLNFSLLASKPYTAFSSGEFNCETNRCSTNVSMLLSSPDHEKIKSSLNFNYENIDVLNIKGKIQLARGRKKFNIAVEGSVIPDKETNFVFYVTMPTRKFQNYLGKFLLSKPNRVLFVELRGPTTLIGTEIQAVFNDFYNFTTKFQLYSSISSFQDVQMAAKYNNESIEIRVGWNDLKVGVVGSTHYRHWSDMDYSLKIYTPFEGLRECTVVARNVLTSGIDFDMSVSFDVKKVGLMLKSEMLPKKQFSIPSILSRNFSSVEQIIEKSLETGSYNLLEYLDTGDSLFHAMVRLNSLLYPPVSLYMFVNQDEIEYSMSLFTYFPFGHMVMKSSIEVVDILNNICITNIYTTCDCLQHLNFQISSDGMVDDFLELNVQLSQTAYNKTKKGHLTTQYTFESYHREKKPLGVYTLNLRADSTFDFIKPMNSQVILRMDDNILGGNINFNTNKSWLSFNNSFEYGKRYLDGTVAFRMHLLNLDVPTFTVSLTKDFNDIEKRVNVLLQIPDGIGKKTANYGLNLKWHNESDSFKAFAELLLPYNNVKSIQSGVFLSTSDNSQTMFANAFFYQDDVNFVKISGKRHRDDLSLNINSSISGLSNIDIHSTLERDPNFTALNLKWIREDNNKLIITFMLYPNSTLIIAGKVDSADKRDSINISFRMSALKCSYNTDLMIFTQKHKLHFTGEYANKHKKSGSIVIMIYTSIPGYQLLQVNVRTKNKDCRTHAVQVNANVISKVITMSVKLKMFAWYEKNHLILHCLFTNPFNTVYWRLNSKIVMMERILLDMHYSADTDDKNNNANLKAHIWNEFDSFFNVSGSVSFQMSPATWRFVSNTTLLVPSLSNIKLSSIFISPRTSTVHEILGKSEYVDTLIWSWLAKYHNNKAESKIFQASAESIIDPNRITACTLVEVGTYQLFDEFNGKSIEKGYVVKNVMQSSNFKEVLTMKVLYNRPKSNHHFRVFVTYPEPVPLISANIDVSSQFVAIVTEFVTPFPAYPTMNVHSTVTNYKNQRQRLFVFKWPSNNALFSFTRNHLESKQINYTDGKLILDFALSTRHINYLKYINKVYKSKAAGSSSFIYNGECLVSGLYERNWTLDGSQSSKKEDHINVEIHNKYVPFGITFDEAIQYKDSRVFANEKRGSVYNLVNRTSFQALGLHKHFYLSDCKETFVQVSQLERNLHLDYHKCDLNSHSTGNLTLRPGTWISYNVKKNDKDKNGYSNATLSLQWPRRDFELKTETDEQPDVLVYKVNVSPNKLTNALPIGGKLLIYHDELLNNSIVLSVQHPLLNKDIVLDAEWEITEDVPLKLSIFFDYSEDLKKKISLKTLIQKSKDIIQQQGLWQLYCRHPSSKFNLQLQSVWRQSCDSTFFFKNFTYQRSYLPIHQWMTELRSSTVGQIFYYKETSKRQTFLVKSQLENINNNRILRTDVQSGENLLVNSFIDVNNDNHSLIIDINYATNKNHTILYKVRGKYMDKLNVWIKAGIDDPDADLDVDAYAAINNSKVITSKLHWRPNITDEVKELIKSSLMTVWTNVIEENMHWLSFAKAELQNAGLDIWLDINPIVQDFLEDVKNISGLRADIKAFNATVRQAYEANEFYLKDMYNFYVSYTEDLEFREKLEDLPKIVYEMYSMLGSTEVKIRESVLWADRAVRNLYVWVSDFIQNTINGDAMVNIMKLIQDVFHKYDKVIKEAHVSFLTYIEQLWADTSILIIDYWTKLLMMMEPIFIKFAYHIELLFWDSMSKAVAFFQGKETSNFTSAYLPISGEIKEDFEELFKGISRRSTISNIQMIFKLLIKLAKEKLPTFSLPSEELNEFKAEIEDEIEELKKLPILSTTLETAKNIYNQLLELNEKLKVGEYVEEAMMMLIEILFEMHRTALDFYDGNARNENGLTNCVIDPENSLIVLEQKLPFRWQSFDQYPDIWDVGELKLFTYLRDLYNFRGTSFWVYYYQYMPLLQLSNWFPPFDGVAIIYGEKYLITFDGLNYEVPKNNCSYILSKDVVTNDFMLVLSFHDDTTSINLVTEDTTVSVTLRTNTVSLNGIESTILPIETESIFMYSTHGVLVIKSVKGFELKCINRYLLCSFRLSGTYFGKIAGLLGTMDNEQENDYTNPTGSIVPAKDDFVSSWLSGSSCRAISETKVVRIPRMIDRCLELFSNKTSSLSPCFEVVPIEKFYQVCIKAHTVQDICSVARAYLVICAEDHVSVRMPSWCISCDIGNGTYIGEGDSIEWTPNGIPEVVDIVLIVEAKHCNKFLHDKKVTNAFINNIAKEFEHNQTHIRYSVVIYGGAPPFDSPTLLQYQNNIFTEGSKIPMILNKISYGNGSTDAFSAILYASSLPFSVGHTKNFVLFLCRPCNPEHMSVEYSVMSNVLLEKGITLHVLARTGSDIDWFKINKHFYGLDLENVFTKTEIKKDRNDMETRRKLKTASLMIGYCSPLALETNGSIFSSRPITQQNQALVKKFLTAFSKRVSTLSPSACQNCECSATIEGYPIVECHQCTTPAPIELYQDWKEYKNLSSLENFDPVSDPDFAF